MAANEVSKQRSKTDGRQHATHTRPQGGLAKDESKHEFGSMGEMASQASDYLSQGASQVRELTRDHEGRTVLIALVAGFGVGMFIGSALAMPHRQPKSWKDRVMAEGLGRRMLERMEGMVPEAISGYFGK